MDVKQIQFAQEKRKTNEGQSMGREPSSLYFSFSWMQQSAGASHEFNFNTQLT